MCCRFVVRLRKTYVEREAVAAKPAPWNTSRLQRKQHVQSSDDPSLDNSNSAMDEASRLGRIIILAQRAGLPPALPNDLAAFWYDPVHTADIEEAGIELPSMPSTRSRSGGGVGDHALPEGAHIQQPPSHVEIDLETWRPQHPSSSSVFPGTKEGAYVHSSTASSSQGRKAVGEGSVWSDDEDDTRTVDLFISPVTWMDLEQPKH